MYTLEKACIAMGFALEADRPPIIMTRFACYSHAAPVYASLCNSLLATVSCLQPVALATEALICKSATSCKFRLQLTTCAALTCMSMLDGLQSRLYMLAAGGEVESMSS